MSFPDTTQKYVKEYSKYQRESKQKFEESDRDKIKDMTSKLDELELRRGGETVFKIAEDKNQVYHQEEINNDLESYKKNIINISNAQITQPKEERKSFLENQLAHIVRRVKLRYQAQKWLDSTPSRKLKKLSPLQYGLINDKCQDFSDLKAKKKQKLLQLLPTAQLKRRIRLNKSIQFFIKIIKTIPVINPSSDIKQLWDIIVSLCLLYSFFVVTLMVSFGLSEDKITYKYLLELILILNSFDIVVTCNMGFYKKGILCKSRASIWKKYIEEQFFLDIISLVPLLIYISLNRTFDYQSHSYQEITLSLLLRWKAIMRMTKRTSQKYTLRPNLKNGLSLLSLIFKILIIAHACACVWIFSGKISEIVYENSWIRTKLLMREPWTVQYLSAFYFCTVTMTTVGYGDVIPTTPIETIVCVIMLLFACGVFGFSVNTIQEILNDFQKNQKELIQKMFIIKNYLNNKQINPALSIDVTEYLEYYWQKNQTSNKEEEQKIVKLLSDSLRKELLIESNKIVLKDCSIFHENFSEEVIKGMVPLIKEQHYTPEEIIISRNIDDEQYNSTSDRSIYFVQEGTVEVFMKTTNIISRNQSSANSHSHQNTSNSDQQQFNWFGENSYKSIRRLKKGDVFGEIEFFTDSPHEMSVRSINFSSILKIQRSDFINMIKKYPEDHENFMYIKDRLIMQQDMKKISYKCYSCKSGDHYLSKCNFIQFAPNKHKVIAVHNKNNQIGPKQQFPSFYETFRFRGKTKISCSWKVYDLSNSITDYFENNERTIENYKNKYLSFSISQCDYLCGNGFNYQNNHNVQSLNQLPILQNGNFSNQIQKDQLLQNDPKCVAFEDGSNAQKLPIKKYFQKQISIPQSGQENSEGSLRSLKSPQKQHSFQIQKKSARMIQESDGMKFPISAGSKLSPKSLFDWKLPQSAGLKPSTDAFAGIQSNFFNHGGSSVQGQTNLDQAALQIQQHSHQMLLLFDTFFGRFDKMYEFGLYYPLNNYGYVIKQMNLDKQQQKKLKQLMISQQRLKEKNIILKKKKNINKPRGSINSNYTLIDQSIQQLQSSKRRLERTSQQNLHKSQYVDTQQNVSNKEDEEQIKQIDDLINLKKDKIIQYSQISLQPSSSDSQPLYENNLLQHVRSVSIFPVASSNLNINNNDNDNNNNYDNNAAFSQFKSSSLLQLSQQTRKEKNFSLQTIVNQNCDKKSNTNNNTNNYQNERIQQLTQQQVGSSNLVNNSQKLELDTSLPACEQHIYSYDHSEKPNINVSMYNTFLNSSESRRNID